MVFLIDEQAKRLDSDTSSNLPKPPKYPPVDKWDLIFSVIGLVSYVGDLIIGKGHKMIFLSNMC